MDLEDFYRGIPNTAKAEELFLRLSQTSYIEAGSLLRAEENSLNLPEITYFKKWVALLFLLPISPVGVEVKVLPPIQEAWKEQKASKEEEDFRIRCKINDRGIEAEFYLDDNAVFYSGSSVERGTWFEVYERLVKLCS